MSKEQKEQVLRFINETDSTTSEKVQGGLNFKNHQEAVGILNSLAYLELITLKKANYEKLSLTDNALISLKLGVLPEIYVYELVPEEGISLDDIKVKLAKKLEEKNMASEADRVMKIAFGQLRNYVKNANKFLTRLEGVNTEDKVTPLLKKIQESTMEHGLDKKQVGTLKKRRLINVSKVTYYLVEKTKDFQTTVPDEGAVDLTMEMLADGSWKTSKFKKMNVKTDGKGVVGGYLHPLLKVREEFKRVFVELGFQEMKTNRFVESSFWNFDALYQPQQHPARDAHDTFFMKDPQFCREVPQEYMERVKKIHEEGGYGSIGYRYSWDINEAKKNILRTHTTAVSSKLLRQLAIELEAMKNEKEFKPRKYFSIDRVFRNETMDKTHLCEFHQMEGMVIDRNLSLGDMIGLFSDFFERIGITELRFKPAFNPYTEPSMEIFGFHPQLKRWTEIGNSGMFRPEMLEPMGLPKDITVLAWGLGLERPTMILYNIDNIQKLVGSTVPLKDTRSNPIVNLGKKK